jgi:hypothetical protein
VRTSVDLREHGFPGYTIEPGGTITSVRSGERLRGCLVGGRVRVKLRAVDGRRRSVAVARLVAAAFLPPPPPGARLIHSRPSSTAVAELSWGTRKDHALRGMRNPHAKLMAKLVRKLRAARARGATVDALAALAGVTRSGAYAAATGRNWKHVTSKGHR